PDIVWFGDALRADVIQASVEAIERCDLLVSIGTSAVVYPAAQLPLLARRAGATMIEINPDETPVSDAYDLCLRGTATDMLGRLCRNLD
ncbi:MAG: NAD-dependent protein deacylase, partial [Myxococcales bacterium]|nr:NAD-dependent protein deacylase [Myxococcales bacterium]